MANPQQARRSDPLPTASPGPVLIGFEGSDGGRDALELGRVLSAIEGGRAIVAIPHNAGLAEEARTALDDPTAEIEEIGVLSPALLLVESARRNHAETLVVGSTRRGKVGRVLLGSDVEQILHKTPCEVVVAPTGYASEGHRDLARIAVAVDGTPGSKAVLARAEELARQAGAAIEIIPLDPKHGGGWWHGVRDTASAIAAACEPDVDLLVAGWRHRMDHFRVGSVTQRLLTETPCPVLVVPNAR